MNSRFNCVVFRWKTVCIEAYRKQDVISLHAALAGNNFESRVCLYVSYMHSGSARIRKLDQSVKLFFAGIVASVKNAAVFPFFLPFRLN